MTMSPAGTAPNSPVVALPPRVLARSVALDRSRPMTSTVLPPATANAPMARAMLPVPMMLMLLMGCPASRRKKVDSSTISRLVWVSTKWRCGGGERRN